FLRPGLGWGGSCFPKATRALKAIADGMGYDFLVLKAAIEQNARQLRGFAAAIERELPQGATVGLLGLAFKAGTADTRESPAIALARLLLRAGLAVNAYDPAVREVAGDLKIRVHSTAAEACDAADAVVIATEWPEFAAIDLGAVRRLTRGDLLFDGRGGRPHRRRDRARYLADAGRAERRVRRPLPLLRDLRHRGAPSHRRAAGRRDDVCDRSPDDPGHRRLGPHDPRVRRRQGQVLGRRERRAHDLP